MTYTVSIRRQDVSYRDEAGEWMDGDSRDLSASRTSIEEFDPGYDGDISGGPVDWAVDRIGQTDAYEPSQSPIGDTLGEHNWLSGSYEDPYLDKITETTVYVTGDFSDTDRAEIFKRVYKRVFPRCVNP